ncbi:hypothetical protein [Roseovarius salinarum]|uniref:hypothetical protein n=1 Tax=Roseovarius salinarum TaxID=1981892 RepID=UPI0012FFE9E9|nr:hypothetical protein [Roseovarius salinarum]
MAVPAQNQDQAPTVRKDQMAFHDVYYSPDRPANSAVAPKMGALEQMYAYYDG